MIYLFITQKIMDLKEYIRSIPDYPKKGIDQFLIILKKEYCLET